MALTDTEEIRVKAIESKLNDVQTALNNMASRQQMKAILHLRQREIDDLTNRVESLEAQILILQS